MKIAIIGSFNSKIPLEKGQIHAPLVLTYNLATELAKMGHNVTFFGSYDKKKIIKHKNLTFCDINYQFIDKKTKNKISSEDIKLQLNLLYEQGYLNKIFLMNDFDLFYSWAAYRICPIAAMIDKPVVLTHHDSTNMDAYNLMFRASAKKNIFTIPISKFMSVKLKYLQQLNVVYNGVDVNEIPNNKPSDYFCWVGRISPTKGLHVAIELAKKMHFKLKVIGPIKDYFPDFGDVSLYASKIRKDFKLNKNIEYLGELNHPETLDIISKARGLIFPSSGIEACPMVPIEAMVAGTPVITTDKGPMPEIVDDKISGFICRNNTEMIQNIKKIELIDRQKCRSYAISRFSSKRMAKDYLEQFERAIKLIKG